MSAVLDPRLQGTPFERPTILSSVGPGWVDLLVEAHARISAIDPAYAVDQYKEKFGLLRLYVRVQDPAHNEAVRAIVSELEQRSATICPDTGQPGELRNVDGWYRVVPVTTDERAGDAS